MDRGAPPTLERRTADRAVLRCAAVIRVPGLGPVRGHLMTLSDHGLLVALPGEIPLGIEVRATLELPGDGGPLELTVLGVRAERDLASRPPVKMGFQIISAAPAAMRRVRELVFGV